MTPERVQELLDKASPGPWTADEIDAKSPYGEWYACEINGPVERTSMGGRGTVVVAMHVGKNERDLIAAAPEIAATYLDLTRRIQTLIDEWNQSAGDDNWTQEVMQGDMLGLCADELAEVLHKHE